MCFGAPRGPHFIAWQGQTPGRAHKGTASSSVSARPPSHHILQSAGRAGSLSPAPCPAAEPSTFLCARGTTEDLTVPLCSAPGTRCPACGRPGRAYIALARPGRRRHRLRNTCPAQRPGPGPAGTPRSQPRAVPGPPLQTLNLSDALSITPCPQAPAVQPWRCQKVRPECSETLQESGFYPKVV